MQSVLSSRVNKYIYLVNTCIHNIYDLCKFKLTYMLGNVLIWYIWFWHRSPKINVWHGNNGKMVKRRGCMPARHFEGDQTRIILISKSYDDVHVLRKKLVQ